MKTVNGICGRAITYMYVRVCISRCYRNWVYMKGSQVASLRHKTHISMILKLLLFNL